MKISLNTIKVGAIDATLFILSFLIVILIYPIALVVLVIPIQLYRKIIEWIVTREETIGRMITGLDAGYLQSRGAYSDKPIAEIFAYFTLKSNVSEENVMKRLKENVHLYPELRQRIVRLYGYYFYKNVKEFKAENHVRIIDKVMHRDEIQEWLAKEGKVPFDPRWSPWQIILVKNFVDPEDAGVKSLFVFRLNHCLTDGYSLIAFLGRLADKPWYRVKEQLAIEPGWLPATLKFCRDIICAPYIILGELFFESDGHALLTKLIDENIEANHLIAKEIPLLELKRFKNISKQYGVSVSSVVFTVIMQAVVKFMAARDVDVPSKRIHLVTPYPLPNHPIQWNKMTNHWVPVKLWISADPTHPVETLKHLDKQWRQLARSPAPHVYHLLFKCLGALPFWLMPEVEKQILTTVLITNFPGPVGDADLFGCPLKDIGAAGNMLLPVAFVATSFGTGQHARLIIGVASGISKSNYQDCLKGLILETLSELEK